MKGKSCWLGMAFLLLVAPRLSAQNWQWTREDLMLNPSGLDLREAASWVWGDFYFDSSFADLDGDGDFDLLVTEKYLTATNLGKARYRFFENQLADDKII